MDHTGTIPHGAVDLSDLLGLLERPGPVVTACLATPAALERASYRDSLRWGDQRRHLEAVGAPSAALDAIDAVIPDAHTEGEGLLVVAGQDGVRLAQHSAVPPRAEWARVETLPSVTQVGDWRQHQPTYLVVLVDHTGADLLQAGGGAPERDESVGTDDYPVTRSAPGGWSQRRYQQRAVDTWQDNAGEVARAVAEWCAESQPEVVAVAGDPRSVGLLVERLPEDVRQRTHHVPGSRAADGGGDATAREVARIVATVTAGHTVALLHEWRRQLGGEGRATDGVEATLEALRRSQVAVLAVHDDPSDDRRAWWADAPGAVAAAEGELDGVAGGPAGCGRLVDVAVRAAVGTGALIAAVPGHGGPRGGMGALLRWSE